MIFTAIQSLLTARVGFTVRPATSPTPIGSLPRVLYTPQGGERPYCDDGPTRLNKARIRVEIFEGTIAAAEQIAAKLTRSAAAALTPGLDGYQGTVDLTRIERIYFPETPNITSAGVTREGANTTIVRLSLLMLVDYRE